MADELWFKRKECTIYYLKGASLVAQMVKNLLQCRRPQFDPWVGKIPWRREWLPTPVFLPGEFHGDRSLVGYSSWSHKELDTTEWLTHTHTHTYSFKSSLYKWLKQPFRYQEPWLLRMHCDRTLYCLHWLSFLSQRFSHKISLLTPMSQSSNNELHFMK